MAVVQRVGGRAARSWSGPLLAAVLTLTFVPPAMAGSPFPVRGIVEGPYGRPWDHGQRMRALRFETAHRWNVYIHAPKDDLYQRTQWRDPYPAGQQRDFDAEIAYARSHGIQWVPNLSPALPLIPTPAPPSAPPSPPICFSCPDSVAALMSKYKPFWRAGAQTFMVSFDDVIKAFAYPQDVATYGQGDEAYGRANGDLLTRLLEALRERDRHARLLMVGADYNGTADTAYLEGLRATLDRDVEVEWTGPGVFSQDFKPSAAKAYANAIGRIPILWENWVTNDADGNIVRQSNRIHLGTYGRKRDLRRAVRGFLLNPMNEADLNLLPFRTAADYFARPGSYRPRRSFLTAVRELGRKQVQTLRAFAEANYSDRFDLSSEAPTFVRRNHAFLRSYRAGGRWVGRSRTLGRELRLVIRAPRVLSTQRRLRHFVAEAQPFLKSAAVSAGTGQAGTALLAAERPSLSVHRGRDGFRGLVAAPDPDRASQRRAALNARDAAMQSDPHNTYGYRGALFDVPPTPAPPNAMDAFVDQVRQLDADWQTTSALAATSVRLTLEGRPVEVGPDGRFRLGSRAAGGLLEATDGSGGQTAIRLPARRHAHR